jgi:hypothetical protein
LRAVEWLPDILVVPPTDKFKVWTLGEKQEKFLGIHFSPEDDLTQRYLAAGLLHH